MRVLDAVPTGMSESIEHQSTLGASQSRRGVFAMRRLLDRVPAVRELAQSPALRELMSSLSGGEARVVRGLLFDKTPQANWKVP
ncbi:MAG: hypothetical protein JWN98_359 [Abditibacteriota bacterium]|nr:hypothetical protein [Abditibacteriota bacterium]